MYKILYKDEPYWINIKVPGDMDFGSATILYSWRLVAYVERAGFWRYFKKYKLLTEKAFGATTEITDEFISEMFEDHFKSQRAETTPTRFINCSPEVEALYK